MLTTLRQRNFFLVWCGGLISMMGDWVLFIALPIYVYQLTGSPLATSGMFLAQMLPVLVLGSVAGVFVDRWDRKQVMLVSNLLLAANLLPLLAVHSVADVWIVYVVACLSSVIMVFFRPAENALVPKLVTEEHLVSANALNATNDNIARLVGPPLGGLLAAWFGLAGVALFDAATFLFAAVLLALVTASGMAEKTGPAPGAGAAPPWTAVWHEWLAGLSLVRRDPFVARMLLIAGLPSLGEGVMAVMFVVWVSELLRGGALELGVLMSAQAVGGLLGGLIVGQFGKRFSAARLIGVGAIVFALLDAVLFGYPLFFPGIWIGIALLVVIGVPVVACWASVQTLLQSGVRDEYRGRVFGTLGTTAALVRIAGTLIGGLLGGLLGPVVLLIGFQSGVYFVVGLLALVLLPRAIQRAPSASASAPEIMPP